MERKNIVESVFTFNEQVLGLNGRPLALLSDAELTYAEKAVKEELQEMIDAHRHQDFIGALDAAGDLLYFTLGFFKRMGLTVDQVHQVVDAIHNANMEKKLGVQNKRGGEGVADAVKPADWVGPEERIAKIFE